MVDKKGILDHLRELDEALNDWGRYQRDVSLEDLKHNRDKRNMVLHAMLISIQSAIDIANHLISEHRLRRPATYRETFEILSEADVLSEQLAEQLSDLAGFRNVLVHIYWRLNLEQIYDVLIKDRDVLLEFMKVVKSML